MYIHTYVFILCFCRLRLVYCSPIFFWRLRFFCAFGWFSYTYIGDGYYIHADVFCLGVYVFVCLFMNFLLRSLVSHFGINLTFVYVHTSRHPLRQSPIAFGSFSFFFCIFVLCIFLLFMLLCRFIRCRLVMYIYSLFRVLACLHFFCDQLYYFPTFCFFMVYGCVFAMSWWEIVTVWLVMHTYVCMYIHKYTGMHRCRCKHKRTSVFNW